MAYPQTARSEFLKEALCSYETGDFRSLSDLANEGLIERDLDPYGEVSEADNRIFGELRSKLLESHGEMLEGQRLSLSARPTPDNVRIVLDYFDRLSPQGQQTPLPQDVLKMLRVYFQDPSKSQDQNDSLPKRYEHEALDARYARDLVNLLPAIVAKASSLDKLELMRKPMPTVHRYFDEAHWCYLYGLRRACAVLCRAILESALKEILGRNHSTRELLDLAGQRMLLDGERMHSCERVFSAGNSAVHQEQRFEEIYTDTEVERVLLDTRKILEDLYS